MNEVQYAARQAVAANAVYSTFLPWVEVELPALPEGVTVQLVDTRACGCLRDDCFYCDALDLAVWDLARIEEDNERAEKYGRGWYVYSAGGDVFDDDED